MSHYYLFDALYRMHEESRDEEVLEHMRNGWKSQVDSEWQTAWESNPFCRVLHDVPDGFLGHAFTQDPPHLRHSTKDLTPLDPRSIQPDSQLFHYPAGDRNR